MNWILVFKPLFKLRNFLVSKFRLLERAYDKLRIIETCVSYELPLNVSKEKSFVTKNTRLGKNVNFNGMKIYGEGEVFIGDNFHSGEHCKIITDIHNYDQGIAIPYDNTYIIKNVKIESNVWLGDNVIILGGVKIEEGAIIQAGSVVSSDIPKYSIAGGHPARVFSKRDVSHYEKLKSQNKFH